MTSTAAVLLNGFGPAMLLSLLFAGVCGGDGFNELERKVNGRADAGSWLFLMEALAGGVDGSAISAMSGLC